MKNKTYRFAVVAALLLALALVFAAPVGAAGDSANGVVTVNTAQEAQDALDKAVDGTTIQLVSNVNYGTLKFNANPGHKNTYLTDIVNAYAYDYVRNITDITIVGAANAKVDGFIFETGAQPGDWYVQVNVTNLVIEGVEFTDALTPSPAGYNAPVMITTDNAVAVDGLTIKNCKLTGNNAKLNLVYLYGVDGAKNVKIIGNTVDGIARLCELRGTENVEITGNTIKNTAEHGMLLTGSGYSGTITITGNTADSIGNRFVRMAGADEAKVVITGNTITNYKGKDADLIKVTDLTTGILTIENNAISGNTAVALQAAINYADDGAVIELGNDITLTDSLIISKSVTIDGKKSDTENYKITLPTVSENRAAIYLKDNNEKIKVTLNNLDVSAPKYYAVKVGSKAELKIENCNLEGWSALYVSTNTYSCETDNADGSEISITNSKLTGTCVSAEVFGTVTIGSNNTKLTISGSTLTSVLKEVAGWQPIILYTTGKSETAGYTGSSVTITDSELTLTPYPYTFEDREGYPERLLLMFDNGFDEFDTASGSFTVNAGVTSNFMIDSKYLDTTNGKLACVATKTDANGVVTEYTVQAVSDNTVIPETPEVESETNADGDTTITTNVNNIDTSLAEENKVTIRSNDASVSIVIKGEGVRADNGEVTVPAAATITATYKEAEADTGDDTTSTEPQVTFQLSVDIKNITQALPVIDATMLTEEKKDIVKDESGKQIKKFLAAITALGDNDKNGVNENLKDGKDSVTIVINVHKSLVDNPHLMAALHLDKDGKPKTGSKPTLTWKENGDFYVVTITGPNFSSYVLVEEEPKEEEVVNNNGGKDTGAGNYQYYPRDVPTSGIIDFGTSKVVKGMELPAGSSGKVTLNTKPTFAMPENGFYAFEIDAPGYNLEAKINGGLSFQIPEADLTAAGWTAKDIVLYHGTVAEYGKIIWEALPTNLVKNENGIAYYKSAINGCSPFYIGFVKDGSVVNTEVVDPVTPPTEEPTDVPGEVLPEIPPVDEPETPATPVPLFAVLAGLGAAVVLRRK